MLSGRLLNLLRVFRRITLEQTQSPCLWSEVRERESGDGEAVTDREPRAALAVDPASTASGSNRSAAVMVSRMVATAGVNGSTF